MNHNHPHTKNILNKPNSVLSQLACFALARSRPVPIPSTLVIQILGNKKLDCIIIWVIKNHWKLTNWINKKTHIYCEAKCSREPW